jgi:hypothetical protein
VKKIEEERADEACRLKLRRVAYVAALALLRLPR